MFLARQVPCKDHLAQIVCTNLRPPRVPNLLPAEQATIYFLTMSVEGRRPVLDNEETWSAIRRAIRRLDRWAFLSLLAMPDHIHMLVSPIRDRDESVSCLLRWFKRWMREELKHEWAWQESGFDRLLRHDESADQKWHYIRMNPVRAGLVAAPDDWPYQWQEGDL